jgi:hypothetical protein
VASVAETVDVPVAVAAAPVVAPKPVAAAVFAPGVKATRQPGLFFGDGTALHPNAGRIVGDGYSYGSVAGDCATTCKGGDSGLFGRPGRGYNGGEGGAAGLFGPGAEGGDGISGVAGG